MGTTTSEPILAAGRAAATRGTPTWTARLFSFPNPFNEGSALILAATLESVFGLCLGCAMFAALMRAGLIAPAVCERCADIGSDAVAPP